jgi:CRISPR/Cas system-associated endonuclease Cas1
VLNATMTYIVADNFQSESDVTHGRELFMPFKSQAQRRKFAQLLVEGKISNQTFEEWNRETGTKKLPERVGSTKRTARRTKVAKKTRKAGKARAR